VSKYFTSIALICAGLGPLSIDVGITHLLNPDWDAHARVHEVWRLSTNLFIAFIGLYLIWIMQKELLAALLSLCLLLGFWVSVFLMPFYDGLAVGQGVDELAPFGVPINIISFAVVSIIQIVGLIIMKHNNQLKL
jgi:hypothetical protein|tara:strand:- start:1914 stop:2318 length:405 start_codon:yes stop_codon:yes gene_type:complete